MLPYFLLLAFFAIGALASGPRAMQYVGAPHLGYQARRIGPMFLIAIIIMSLMIGLRYRVGGDWENYVYIFNQLRGKSLPSSLEVLEPGFGALNWLTHQIGYDVWFVNLVCAGIFGWGLYRFCKEEPAPWLAAAIAIPYMVTVVAMGYTRQAAALGILMAGLARQSRGASVVNFAFYAAGAALFHRTAIVAFPLIALTGKGNKVVNFLIVVSLSYGLYTFFLSDSLDAYVENYINTQYSSQGAFIRVAMNALAAALFWFSNRNLGFSDEARKIWRNFSIASLASLVALAIVPSSTAVDRISLYLMPLQLVILGRIGIMSKNQGGTTAAVIAYAAIVQFVWLNFAQFAMYWVPYQFYPFQ